MAFVIDLLQQTGLFEPEPGIELAIKIIVDEQSLSRKMDFAEQQKMTSLWYLSAAELSIPGVLPDLGSALRPRDLKLGLSGPFRVLRRNLLPAVTRTYCTLTNTMPGCFGAPNFDEITIFSSDSVKLRRLQEAMSESVLGKSWNIERLCELIQRMDNAHSESPLELGRELAAGKVIRFQGLVWAAKSGLLYGTGEPRDDVARALEEATRILFATSEAAVS